VNGERSSARASGVPVAKLVVIGAIASALGIAWSLLIDWFPTSGAEQSGPIDTLWHVLLIVSVPVFVLVVTVVLYSAVRWRMRPGEELDDGPPIHGNTRLEIVWTAIPAVLLVALCTYAYVVLTDVEEAKADTMEVRVVGEQFAWTYFYRDRGKELQSSELYLPVNRPVHFTVQSKDVIHDFFVPAFRVKTDAVRGTATQVRATPNRVGTYPVICAELCGLGHATMRSTVRVVQPRQFDAWLAKLRQGGTAGGAGGGSGGAGASTDGKALFAQAAQPVACGSCHTLADAGTHGTTGPNLDRVLKGKDAAFIKQSIEDPNAEIANGYSPGIMPDYSQSLKPDQVDALVKYLAEVTR
jgi:cytochrome c oxidase subunit 2